MDNVKIQLKNNCGFKWHEADGSFFKGYLLSEGKFISGPDALIYLKRMLEHSSALKDKLIKLNGIFSFVITKKDETLICADRTRSFPLFYVQNGYELTLSDDPELLRTENSELSPDAINVFLHTGYTTGSRTLYKDIFQIQAGEFIKVCTSEFKKEFYHFYESGTISNEIHELEKELHGIINKIGDDLSESLKDKIPVIPLSSGFDSRLIAVLLKQRGFKNVITFTYGRKNNPELELSKKSAEKLNYEWRFIEYCNDSVKGFIASDDFKNYYPAASNFSSMFYLQEYFALEQLKKFIPENSVFIPGHSGDFFAGSHLNKNIISSGSLNEIIYEIKNKHYGNKIIYKVDNDAIENSIRNSLKKKESYNYLDFEHWDLKERQAKFILNSNRIYEHFGFEYRLPLMDYRLMDFFAKVSPDLKYGKKLYDKVLREKFFQPEGLNFDNETNPSLRAMEMQERKNSLKKIIPKKIINIYKEKRKKFNDIYFNIGVTDQMIEDILSSGGKIDNTGENRNSIIIQWYIHQIMNKKI